MPNRDINTLSEESIRRIAREVFKSERTAIESVNSFGHRPQTVRRGLIDEYSVMRGTTGGDWSSAGGAEFEPSGSIQYGTVVFYYSWGTVGGSGITHDTNESTPHDNGNFVVNVTGRYRFRINLKVEVDCITATWPTYTATTSTDGSPSHYHTVPVRDVAYAGYGPGFLLSLWRKVGSGSIDWYEDEEGSRRAFIYHYPNSENDDRSYDHYVEFTFNADAGDRLSLRISPLNLSINGGDIEYRMRFYGPNSGSESNIAIERISQKKEATQLP